MIRKTFMAAALLVAAVFVEAQQMPPGKWWRRDAVVQQLQLTTEQQNRLDEIFNAAATELIDARANIEKAQVALRAEIERQQVRRPEIQRLAARVSEARGKLFEREVMMLLDMRGVLNEEQWVRMRAFLDRMHELRDRPKGNGPRPAPKRDRKP